MKASSSSTSSSDSARFAGAGRVALYTVAWLVVLDLLIGLATRRPDDPRTRPSRWQEYFDYGRSVESKLRYMVRESREQSAPISHAGWIDASEPVGYPARPSRPGAVLVAAYGQSFTAYLLKDVGKIDPRFELRMLGGPAAPLSHSYAMYRMDHDRHAARVVVVGILASTFPRLTTLTNMTLMFEGPQPATFPRYLLRDGELVAIESSVRNFADLKAALSDRTRWASFLRDLERHDAGYDARIFEQDLLDASTLGRLIRRGLGQRHVREITAKYVGPDGFTNHAQLIDVADALLGDFAERVRKQGRLPYVLLINDAGYADHLPRALGPKLARRGIPYFSTHELAPTTRPGMFQRDGHFRPEINHELATALHAALQAELERHDAGAANP